MKRQGEFRRPLVAATLMLGAIILLTAPCPVLAAPPIPGTTVLSFSENPATLSGDSAIDVTITTQTTAPGAPPALISEGKVMIEVATDGAGNPVPAASVVAWLALNAPGVSPDGSGVTELDLDLDNVAIQVGDNLVVLEFACGTVAGFRAHYVTGGGSTKVATHQSVPVDLTVECDCPCDATETAFAFGGTCFLDLGLGFNNWGWSIGPLIEGSYTFDIYAGAGQCNLDNGQLVGQLSVLYTAGTATVTYEMDVCRTLIQTHLYIGNVPVPTGPSGEYTVAPGQYGNIHEGTVEEPIGESDQFVVTGLSGEIYLIAHAVVCVEPELPAGE